MTHIEFDAFDYRADQSFRRAHYAFDGDTARGWTIRRDGAVALELGPGYRLLRTQSCGVCSTDLARHFLPFPLPQVTGHEVIARDEQNRRFVVEINASHEARGIHDGCPFCRAGLPTHCPQRIVLGIHDLPGGFGPWMLVPVQACIEVPDAVPDDAAVLIEPFAAALHGVDMLAPRAGERVAVLGPRRLGMLVVAALAGVRNEMRRRGAEFTVAALARDPALLEIARGFGATELHQVDGAAHTLADCNFDVVIDTTGNPEALPTAVRLARREVHLKSTHGRPAAGIAHLTELVVDELAIERFPLDVPAMGTAVWDRLATGPRPRVAWLAATSPPAWLQDRCELHRGDAADLAAHYDRATAGLPRADVAVVENAAQVDLAIRPRAGREEALIRPRGSILLLPGPDAAKSPLLAAIAGRGLRLSSSRCGDFRRALDLLVADPSLRDIGRRLVTHRFTAGELPRAFQVAHSRGCIKAVVAHSDEGTA
ncbi:MAG: alcohol dehydrogenase catalytic domain-containing protein [Planctomycetota bacterium]